ncbi:MAG: DNA polymerase IV [Candidatus Omnitrophica bacterium]|nr:DNA polymerase IV [Candidatus Omnitrophota bacterium]
MNKFVVHVDMDAFFAAVEQRDNVEFQGKPVVIGADPKEGKGRGVVSTCSYEARNFGIHSAMPISFAYRKCPHAIFLPVDMVKYFNVSQKIFKLLYEFTPVVEPVSIDEAFLDISGSYHIFETVLKTCQNIKTRIKNELGLTASVGVGPTKTSAKIASDLNKPDGLVEVTKDKLLEFLWPLNVRKLWGVGVKGEVGLNNIGIKTIGDLARLNQEDVMKTFGKNGLDLWFLANGIDERIVEKIEKVKSISHEHTFLKDVNNKEVIENFLINFSEKVSFKLRENKLKAKLITLKIRLDDFSTYTRSKPLNRCTNFIDIIYKTVKNLFYSCDVKDRKIRLIGVKVSNFLSQEIKDSLLYDLRDIKKENIHLAVDKIKEKFGVDAISRASCRDF